MEKETKMSERLKKLVYWMCPDLNNLDYHKGLFVASVMVPLPSLLIGFLFDWTEGDSLQLFYKYYCLGTIGMPLAIMLDGFLYRRKQKKYATKR